MGSTSRGAAGNSYLDDIEGLCNNILNHHTFVSQDYPTTYCVHVKVI